MARCPGCGKFLSNNVEKCPNCGALLRASAKVTVKPVKEEPKKAAPKVEEDKVVVSKAPAVVKKGSDPVIFTRYEKVYVEEPLGFDSVSYFDGELHQLVGWTLLGLLVTVLTLGICFPFAYAYRVRWECKHTVIRGYREVFDGKVSSIFGKWVLWYFLTIITLGIYGWWNPIRFRKWKVARIKLVKDKRRK